MKGLISVIGDSPDASRLIKHSKRKVSEPNWNYASCSETGFELLRFKLSPNALWILWTEDRNNILRFTAVRLKVEQNQLVGVSYLLICVILLLKCLRNGHFLEQGN